ncbi:GntR family transcriptional regulator [Saccharopolyspora phatthalungensis]|uniref:DNA-binding GntR family transcriptional regulator n=1 Tax=Saccharopolyspora phatthalungensis TaxID=664693 RepID=A0A840QE95_9PSEU|nr:GntR family transcriptional regulator [Saccharopolyspora phatthalungensis]MBB5156998.1 DNA-binding GntR family transcriptional regulator [Saccharopolyspora phatthalungensis]
MTERAANDSQSLTDRVTDQLRDAIFAHEFKPGDRLAATALANRFSVSATPLREAFARLAGEGWVSYLPQRGVRVAEISVKEMEEIYELRTMLEPMALRRSVAAGDDAWRDEVDQAFRRMQDAGGDNVTELTGRAYAAYEEVHVEFHKTTLRCCDSAWLLRIAELLTDQSRRFRQLSQPIRTDYGSVADEHRAIMQACLDGDEDAAAEAVLIHMNNTRKAILQWAEESTD